MDLKLSGKKALICAASRGLGKAIAQSLGKEDCELFLCARNQERLQETAEEIRSYTTKPVHFKVCDLTSNESRQELIDAVKKTTGGIDILIHNVGGPVASAAESTSIEDSEAGFQRLFIPVAHLNQAFVPKMKENKWGRIVAVTSLAVLEPIAGLAVSNATRTGLTAMLKTLADEVAAHAVTVNCVAPGWISTDRSIELMEVRCAKSRQSREDYEAEHLKTIPAGRMGTPHEFGDVVTFLCSGLASYVTGSTICVDGGKRRSTT